MSVVRAILRSDVSDLTVVSWGGPDVGILCAAGKVKRLVYAFVSLDSIPLEPHFRKARQSGAIEDEPYDEGMFLLGLQAAAWRVPFLPTRVGLGSDILRDNDRVRMVTSPFDDAEELVAVPALTMDAAFVHMNRADARGNGQYLGPDPYMDDLFLGAADKRFLSTERIVPTEDLAKEGPPQSLVISRLLVDGVIEAPNGAHFTSCAPDYERDEAFQKQYAASAKSPEAWTDFRAAWLDLSEVEYQARLRTDGGSE
jgi:glutaconate CoA-transferase subunit A